MGSPAPPRAALWNGPSPELGAAGRLRKMEAGEPGPGGRAGSSADSLAEEEEEDEDEEGPGSGRSSRTSSLVSGLLTELYSAAEAAAPSGSARSRVLRELQRRPSQVEYLRLKGTACPAPPGPGAAPAASLPPLSPQGRSHGRASLLRRSGPCARPPAPGAGRARVGRSAVGPGPPALCYRSLSEERNRGAAVLLPVQCFFLAYGNGSAAGFPSLSVPFLLSWKRCHAGCAVRGGWVV